MTERADALRAVETEIGRLVRRVKRTIADRAVAVHPDLQGVSYLILGWVARSGPVRASQIVEEFRIDKGALSRQLQHMTELDLIERTPDPEDGRASLVAVTEEARNRLAEVLTEQRKLADQRLTDWSTPDLVAFSEELHRYLVSLG